MARLSSFADDLWVVGAPLSFMGFRLGTRMSVVRLQDGGVLLHSPVPIDDALAAEIEAIGPVRHIVAPNLFHHLYAGPALERWRSARAYGAAGLAKKRPDLRLDAVFADDVELPFAAELEPLTIRGCQLGETVLFHKRSGTVVASDLTENFLKHDHLPTRLYLKLSGVYGKPGWTRLLRWMYHDRKTARESVDRLLRWNFDRLVIAHGEPIAAGARSAIEQTFTFL